MCGIAGIIDLKHGVVSAGEVQSLCDALAHRGPDDWGVKTEGPAGFGSTRLAVLDLSPGGHMPMVSEDNRYWVTYNGEVYNYREIRSELETKGHRFRSTSDTEVVLHSYREWGTECVDRLTGMFAFAIWDSQRRCLFCARDRLGVKPFFYLTEFGRFVFASEIHALYRYVEPTPDRIDEVGLDYYLAYGYLPPDRCLIRGLHKLPPSHALMLDERGLKIWRYWEVKVRPDEQASFPEALQEVERRLHVAVKRRLVSDVPLGCFLSGGIDSGLVAAIASQHSEKQLRTFSVRFEGAAPDQDETPLARKVASRYQTDHEELRISAGGTKPLLTHLISHFGEPFADVSALAVYQISRAAKRHITVALTGDGGDESFAGYGNVRSAFLAAQFRAFTPDLLRRGLRRVAEWGWVHRTIPHAARANFWLGRYVEGSVEQQYDLVNHWDRQRRSSLYLHGILPIRCAASVISACQANAGALSHPDLHVYTDLHLRLPGDYLTKVDIASNANSLEVRSPFLDHQLVEYAATIPLKIKLLRGRQKGLLRELAKRYLPPAVVSYPKRGFAPPLATWLRHDWSPTVQNLVGGSLAKRGTMFNGDRIRATLAEHLEGKSDHAQRLWNLLCLEVWWQLFVDKTLKPGDEI